MRTDTVKVWYHYILQGTFILLAIQNLLILLSIPSSTIPLDLPYYIDLIGFALLGVISLFHYIKERTMYGIIGSILLLVWVGIRFYIQFILIENLNYAGMSEEMILTSLGADLSVVSILLFINSLLLLGYTIFVQMTSRSNLVLLFTYLTTNLLATILIGQAFLLRPNKTLVQQIDLASLGFAIKLMVVPILGILAFTALSFDIDDIYITT